MCDQTFNCETTWQQGQHHISSAHFCLLIQPSHCNSTVRMQLTNAQFMIKKGKCCTVLTFTVLCAPAALSGCTACLSTWMKGWQCNVCVWGSESSGLPSLFPIQCNMVLTDPEMAHTHQIYSFGWISEEQPMKARRGGEWGHAEQWPDELPLLCFPFSCHAEYVIGYVLLLSV